MSPITTSLSTGTIFLWTLHWVSATMWIAGAILLCIWAIRSLTASRLRAAGAALFVAGVLGTIVTIPAALVGMRSMLGASGPPASMESMMTMMQAHTTSGDPAAHAEHQQMEKMMQTMLDAHRPSQLP